MKLGKNIPQEQDTYGKETLEEEDTYKISCR